MTIKKPDMIMFDWDHTLVRPPDFVFEADHSKLLEYYTTVGNLTSEQIELAVREDLSFSLPLSLDNDDIRPFVVKNSDHVLSYFFANGMPIGIVSNKLNVILRLEFKLSGWDKFCHAIVGRGDAETHKPQPHMLWMAARQADIRDDGNVWFVGDSSADTKAARNAGFVAIHCKGGCRGLHQEPEREDMHCIGDGANSADHIIDDISDLITLYSQLN